MTLLRAIAISSMLSSLTLILTSCAAFEDSQAPGCFEQADCPVDNYCDDGVCLLRGEGNRRVIVESIRAVTSDTPSQITTPDPLTLSTSAPARLTVFSGLEFNGALITPDETAPSGRVEVERVDQEPSSRLPNQTPTSFGVFANEGVFKFRALPGTYSFTFSPDAVNGIGRPTFRYQNLVLSTATTSLQLSYPAQSSFREISGQLAINGASQDYFEGGTIQFSFISSNLELRSAPATIDPNGNFRVTLPPNPSGQWTVEIPSTPSGRVGFTTNIEHFLNNAALEPIPVEIPQRQRARLRVADSLSDAYIGVRYELLARVETSTGTIKQRLKAKNATNPSGWVELDLVPGEFSVKVIPENNPLYLEQEFPLCVSQDSESLGCVTPRQSDSLFALGQGYIFQGILKDVAGLAVPNVPVTVRNDNGDLVTESLTDSTGQFSATVNMGQQIRKSFEFGFQPDLSTEIPWHYVTREVDINNDATGIFSLPLGFAMSGLVVDEEQRPQTNNILRIFDVETLQLIAIASPGSEGYFTVFLANDGEK